MLAAVQRMLPRLPYNQLASCCGQPLLGSLWAAPLGLAWRWPAPTPMRMPVGADGAWGCCSAAITTGTSSNKGDGKEVTVIGAAYNDNYHRSTYVFSDAKDFQGFLDDTVEPGFEVHTYLFREGDPPQEVTKFEDLVDGATYVCMTSSMDCCWGAELRLRELTREGRPHHEELSAAILQQLEGGGFGSSGYSGSAADSFRAAPELRLVEDMHGHVIWFEFDAVVLGSDVVYVAEHRAMVVDDSVSGENSACVTSPEERQERKEREEAIRLGTDCVVRSQATDPAPYHTSQLLTNPVHPCVLTSMLLLRSLVDRLMSSAGCLEHMCQPSSYIDLITPPSLLAAYRGKRIRPVLLVDAFASPEVEVEVGKACLQWGVLRFNREGSSFRLMPV